MYQEAKKVVARQHYSSVSELVRDALRQLIQKKRITENGFTEEFEDAVLEAKKEPVDYSDVWETEEDVDKYFKKLAKELYGKSY